MKRSGLRPAHTGSDASPLLPATNSEASTPTSVLSDVSSPTIQAVSSANGASRLVNFEHPKLPLSHLPASNPSMTQQHHVDDDKACAAELLAKDAFHRMDILILPILWLVRLFCVIDRCNLMFASMQMQRDLRFDNLVYGTGAGLFFAGCSLFQLPSTLLLSRISVPHWLGMQCFCFGIVSAAFSLVQSAPAFYTLRFFLGAAEAGCFPCTWYYLSQMYPDRRLGNAFAMVMTGGAVAHIIVGPIAAGVLSLDGVWGLRGWQWMFVLQGAPSIALGLLLPSLLPANIFSCTFLSPAQQYLATMEVTASMQRSLKHLKTQATQTIGQQLWHCLRLAHLRQIALVRFLGELVAVSLITWLPAIINAIFLDTPISASSAHAHTHGHMPMAPVGGSSGGGRAARLGVYVVLLTAVPFTATAVASVIIAKTSDHRRQYAMFTGMPYIASGVVLAFVPLVLAHHPGIAFTLMVLACIAPMGCNTPITTLLAACIPAPLRLVGMPLANTVVSLGGFVGPVVVGALLDKTQSFGVAVYLLAGITVVTGLLSTRLKIFEDELAHDLAIEHDLLGPPAICGPVLGASCH